MTRKLQYDTIEKLNEWGRVYKIRGDIVGSTYGNCILADWAKYGGPPPRGREIPKFDETWPNRIESYIVGLIRDEPQIAFAMRARYCGWDRVKVERFELCKKLLSKHYREKGYKDQCSMSVRSYQDWINIGEFMVENFIIGHENSLQNMTKYLLQKTA